MCETAEKLGITEENVRVRQHRALSLLGLALDNQTGLFAEMAEGDCSMAADPIWTRKLVLNYADSASYIVLDHDSDLDNTASADSARCHTGS